MAQRVTLEQSERRVLVDGNPVKLRGKCFDVLALLASRPGHLFPKEALIERVWEGRHISADVLKGCVREIRRALSDRAASPIWIETISGTGYRLLRPLKFAEPICPRTAYAGLGDDCASTVAVLPFAAGDPQIAAIAAALSRDVTIGLARTRWIQVAANASAEALDSGSRTAEAASTLRVRYVVRGDVERATDRLSARIMLIEPMEDRILWADRIEQDGPDVQILLEDICGPIVATIESEVELAEQRRAQLSPVRSVDSWLGFHRSMGLLQRQDKARLEEAARVLCVASRADPNCARVAAARSWLCWQRLFFGTADEPDRMVEQAYDYARESIALDPRDPLGHWALGRAQWRRNEMEAAACSIGTAVSLNPSFARGRYALSISYYMLGRDREAISECGAAIRLSPLDPMAFAFHCVMSQLLCFNGDFKGAREHAGRIVEHPNVHAFGTAVAAWVYELCGDRSAAVGCIDRLRQRWPSYSSTDYANAMFHTADWYPRERRRAIDDAFNRLGF